MANIDHAPSRTMLNLLHVLPAFAEEAELRLNAIVELNSNTINKYELITETGHQARPGRIQLPGLSLRLWLHSPHLG
jgi:hypothetical protein